MDNSHQVSFPIKGTAASPTALTSSYADTAAVFSVNKQNEMMLYVYYTMGAAETANSIQVRLSFSASSLAADSALWAVETAEALSGSTITLTRVERSFAAVSAAATYDVFCIPVHLCDGYMRVDVKETGVSSNAGSCYIVGNSRGR